MHASILKDKKDISAILTVLLEAFINHISELPLSICTSIQADDRIVHDLLKASKIGKDQMKKFVDERIDTNYKMSFFDPLKMNKLNTFMDISKVTACNYYADSYS